MDLVTYAILNKKIQEMTSGKDGKSAYEYAQEGGYTGTEEEFSQKLAKTADDTAAEIQPNKLYVFPEMAAWEVEE